MRTQAHLTVNSDLQVLSRVQGWFEGFCSRFNLDASGTDISMYGLKLALVEGFTNAVRHAHYQLPPETEIDLELTLQDNRVRVCIWDRGAPFDPETMDEPEPGTLRQGGYGWFLLRRLADRVAYQRCGDAGNCLSIEKELPALAVDRLPERACA